MIADCLSLKYLKVHEICIFGLCEYTTYNSYLILFVGRRNKIEISEIHIIGDKSYLVVGIIK